MKLKKEFLVHISGDETVLVPTAGADFSGVVRGNKSLGAILELLKTDTSEEKITADMAAKYEAPLDRIAADVQKVLSQLRGIGALDE